MFGRPVIDVDGVAVRVDRMASWDLDDPPHEPYDLTAELAADKDGFWQASISWPVRSGPGVSVFRIIAADREPPESAADTPAATLEVTVGASLVDSTRVNPSDSGIRHYEVWLHTGKTIDDAVANPPYEYARGHVVWPPTSFRVQPQGRRDLVASWHALPDQSFRLASQTLTEARRGRPTATDCQPVDPGGYLHQNATPGPPLVYTLYSGAPVGTNVEWSSVPARVRAELPVSLEPVLDLTVEDKGEDRVDLLWTAIPDGTVEIYMTERPPPSDLQSSGQVPRSQLLDYPYYLDLERRLRVPVSRDGARSRMANVDVSADVAAVYFIPISSHREEARPGRPLRWLSAKPPTDLAVEDRVRHVLVAFRWPRGATRVDLWRAQLGEPPQGPPWQSLSREDYDTYGGFLLSRAHRFIRSGDCTLHLAGLVSYTGEDKHSPSASIDATLPAIVEYQITTYEKRERRKTQQVRRVMVRSQEKLADVNWSLVWSPDRLPLATEDGSILASYTQTIPAGQPISLGDLPTLPDHGFLRLIVDRYRVPAVALLDPPLAQLRLGHG